MNGPLGGVGEGGESPPITKIKRDIKGNSFPKMSVPVSSFHLFFMRQKDGIQTRLLD
jgi:hypothetical protein